MTIPDRPDMFLRTKSLFHGVWVGMLSLLLGSISLHARAGQGSIQGRVQAPASGDYIANAKVVVSGTAQEALTDSSGFYQPTGVRTGNVTLCVTYVNFDEATVQAPVADGQSVTILGTPCTRLVRRANRETSFVSRVVPVNGRADRS